MYVSIVLYNLVLKRIEFTIEQIESILPFELLLIQQAYNDGAKNGKYTNAEEYVKSKYHKN